MDLAGKTILIVGGSSGIGLSTAQRAAAVGAKLLIAARSRQRLDAALARLPQGTQAEELDFANASSVSALAGRMGSIDHPVLSASSAVAWAALPTSRKKRSALHSRTNSGAIGGSRRR